MFCRDCDRDYWNASDRLRFCFFFLKHPFSHHPKVPATYGGNWLIKLPGVCDLLVCIPLHAVRSAVAAPPLPKQPRWALIYTTNFLSFRASRTGRSSDLSPSPQKPPQKITRLGHECLFYPKFHCELNHIGGNQ